MAIQLGTVAPIGFDDFPAGTWLAALKELGCTVVQAYRNPARPVRLAEMQDAIAAGGMPCDSLHGIFGEDYDPSSPFEPTRKSAVDSYKSEGELCLALGGSLVVVHCSTVRHQGVAPEERAIRVLQLRKSIAELGNYGRDIGVRYAFENLPSYHPVGSDVAELAAMLEDVGAPSTGLCFDCGHANMIGDAAQALRHAGKQVIYMHLNDNSGSGDEHLMLSYGTVDADALARAVHEIGYAGTMMLEVFYPLERLRQLIDEGCAERLAKIVARAEGKSAPHKHIAHCGGLIRVP